MDAGGDLRLHDDQSRTPRDWAEAGAQEDSPKVCADYLFPAIPGIYSVLKQQDFLCHFILCSYEGLCNCLL